MKNTTMTTRSRMYADRPGCPTRHHNTVGAYRMGCRCPEATEAKRLRDKRHRQGRATPRQVDATGTTRRVQALMLAGHRAIDIATELCTDCETVRGISRGSRRFVYVATAQAVAALAHRWADKPGRSGITASRARAAGYVSLAAWEDIDNPCDRADLGGTGRHGVDEVAVRRVIDGKGDPKSLAPAEREAAMDAMQAAGHSRTAIAVRLHVKNETVNKHLGPPERAAAA